METKDLEAALKEFRGEEFKRLKMKLTRLSNHY